ncbi:MAG: leucine-rich repeat protein [Acutalibacteraceae bacterium]
MKKRILSVLLALAMMLSVFALNVCAAEPGDEIVLFSLDSWADDYLTIPSDLATSYQIKTNGAAYAQYEIISGDSVTVSASGLVSPNVTVFYWIGNMGTSVMPEDGVYDSVSRETKTGISTVRITTDKGVSTLTFEVKEYAHYYADQVMDKYIADNITDSMSGYEKLDAVCKFVASYEYSASHSSAAGMIVSGGGDCWASTFTIINMCEKLSIDAWSRNGNRDPGAGSGHMNAMAQIDGKYYELEAGYYEPAPRFYSIKERTSLFSYSYVTGGIEVYQYDGNDDTQTVLNVPQTIDGKEVVGIGNRFIYFNSNFKEVILPDTVKYISSSAFNSCSALESLNIPKNVSEIGEFAFTNCQNLKNFTCDSENSSYTVKDGMLFTKDLSKLICVPSAEKAEIPSDTQNIAEYAFYYNSNIKSVSIPGSVKEIGEGTFGECISLTAAILQDGVESIGLYAFRGSGLYDIVIPDSVTMIDKDAFYVCTDNLVIHCNKSSYAEAFAKENGISFDYNTDDPTAIKYGDANGDGTINMLDVLLIRKYIAKQPVTPNLEASDVTADDNVNMLDVLLIRKFIAKQPVTLGPQ